MKGCEYVADRLIGAVDIGGTKISVGLVDAAGRVIIENHLYTYTGIGGADRAVIQITEELKAQCIQAGRQLEDLLGIGVVCAGPVRPQSGIVENPYTLQGWEGYPIVRELWKSTSLPVLLENDANGAIMGEVLLRGLEKDKVLMLTFGTGIGVACWDHGEVYAEGEYHPEMGHIVIASYGDECYCGHKGCFESLCSGSALNERAKKLGFIDFDNLHREYQEGNPTAFDFINLIRSEMKAGVWNLNLIFKPDCIILGGGLMKDYFGLVSETIIEDSKNKSDFIKESKVLQGNCETNPALAGAALLVLKKVNHSLAG